MYIVSTHIFNYISAHVISNCIYLKVNFLAPEIYLEISVVWDELRLLPYFFGYKTEFVSFQNNPKYLDPSYKTDLDLLDCLGRVKLVL